MSTPTPVRSARRSSKVFIMEMKAELANLKAQKAKEEVQVQAKEGKRSKKSKKTK